MKFYHVGDGVHCITLEEARQEARHQAKNSYHDVVVERVEIELTKENVRRLLNSDGGTHQMLGVVYTAKAKLKHGRDDI